MSFWDWAVQAYARPGVEALCLTLQDEHGQCVSYLLWAAWTAAEGRAIGAAAMAEAAASARDWETTVLRPLRSVRRALKEARPGMPVSGQAALRDRIKAEELGAEKLLLEALEARAAAPSSDPTDVRSALAAAVRAWEPATPPPTVLLDDLSRAFSIT